MKNFTIEDLKRAKAIMDKNEVPARDWGLFQETINDFYKKSLVEFEQKLKAYLTKNLNNLGYQFNSDDEFIEFIKARVSRIGFDDKPNCHAFYIDFVDYDNRGIFIGSYSDKVDVFSNGNTIKATIGGSFGKGLN